MWVYLVKRIFSMIPILLGVSLLTFFLMSLAPGGFLDSLLQNPQVSPEMVDKLHKRQEQDGQQHNQWKQERQKQDQKDKEQQERKEQGGQSG